VGRGVPYNHLLFTDTREGLVETCLQLLVTALDAHDVQDDEASPAAFVGKPQIFTIYYIFLMAFQLLHRLYFE
jgi:hypothetical protein